MCENSAIYSIDINSIIRGVFIIDIKIFFTFNKTLFDTKHIQIDIYI